MVFPIKQRVLIALLLAIVLVCIGLGLFFTLRSHEEVQPKHVAAIVTNGLECSDIGRDVLKENGSVADAAIAALICEGVTCPQSTGLGGGFVLTIYTKSDGKAETLVARETAPLSAFENMFVNDSSVSGGKSIAVPGELKGYWELHKKYGKLPWARLFQPTIELCRKGHVVSDYLGNILKRRKELLLHSPTLAEIYIDPKTNDVYKVGDRVKRLKLAETLELIAKEGADTLYNNGTLAQRIVKDIRDVGGIITIEDLMKYEVRWEKPVVANLRDNKTLYSFSTPGSGAMITFIVNLLNGYLTDGLTVKSMHRIAEAFKYAYARRSELADTRFVPEAIEVLRNLTDVKFAEGVRALIEDDRTYNDYRHYGAKFNITLDQGTANINVLAPNGDAIAVTGSINTLFGSKFRSPSTGIILNDSMDDFSVPGRTNAYGLPASPANFIRPQKMPLSSMSPSILIDGKGDAELIVGAAGGSKITSSIAYVLLRYLYFNESVWDAVHAPRLHHQLIPMRLEYEAGFSNEIINGLEKIGHKMHLASPDSGFASLTAIGRDGNKLVPVFDPRRLGSSSVY